MFSTWLPHVNSEISEAILGEEKEIKRGEIFPSSREDNLLKMCRKVSFFWENLILNLSDSNQWFSFMGEKVETKKVFFEIIKNYQFREGVENEFFFGILVHVFHFLQNCASFTRILEPVISTPPIERLELTPKTFTRVKSWFNLRHKTYIFFCTILAKFNILFLQTGYFFPYKSLRNWC